MDEIYFEFNFLHDLLSEYLVISKPYKLMKHFSETTKANFFSQ